jgi:hypothetical protein
MYEKFFYLPLLDFFYADPKFIKFSHMLSENSLVSTVWLLARQYIGVTGSTRHLEYKQPIGKQLQLS